jgi:hypothetical protein
MLKSALKKLNQNENKNETRAFSTNPIGAAPKDVETLQRIEETVKGCMKFLDDKNIDNILKKELGKDYPELALVVKERLMGL